MNISSPDTSGMVSVDTVIHILANPNAAISFSVPSKSPKVNVIILM